MSVQYFDFEDKPIHSANYYKKPDRGFYKEEKYYKIGNKKTVNPDFDLQYSKTLRNKYIGAERMRNYPSLADLADAIYWEKKGNVGKMNQYISKIDRVKADHPLI